MDNDAVDIDEAVATRIRGAIDAAGLTQHAVSKKVGIPWASWDRLIHFGSFRVRQLKAIADVCDVPLAELLVDPAEVRA